MLDADAQQVIIDDGDDSTSADQTKYDEDSQEFQNLETTYNGMVNGLQTTVTNLSQAQTQISDIDQSMTGDATYISQLVSGPLT